MHAHPSPMQVLRDAEAVVIDENATPEAIRKAIASVDALGRPDYSRAIRRTLQHEANHMEE